MRFRDADTCKTVAHMPEISAYVREKLSGTVLVISQENIPLITSILKKSGYHPEVYGTTLKDNASTGGKYSTTTVNKLLEKNKMPEVHLDFTFPEHLLSNENGQ